MTRRGWNSSLDYDKIRLDYLVIFKQLLIMLTMRANEREKDRKKKDAMEEAKHHNA